MRNWRKKAKIAMLAIAFIVLCVQYYRLERLKDEIRTEAIERGYISSELYEFIK